MSDISAFDPNAFLHAQVTEVNEKRPPLPEENPADPTGTYLAVVGEVSMKTGEKDGRPWVSAIIPLKIDVPQQLQDSMKLPPQLTLTDRAFIDLTADGKGIDNSPGKNRAQKNYREALDLNKPGDVWSWAKASNQVLRVKIKHELYQDSIQERIAAVLKR